MEYSHDFCVGIAAIGGFLLGLLATVIYMALRKAAPIAKETFYATFATDEEFQEMLKRERELWQARYEEEQENTKLQREAEELKKGFN